MESYSVMAILSATDKNYTSTLKSAGKTMDSLGDSSNKTRSAIMRISGTAVVFQALDVATKAVVDSLDKAISRYDTMNRFPKVMSQIGFATNESEKSIKKLANGIEGLPTSLDAVTGSTQKIALLTGNLDKATSTSIALNNAFLSSGASTADAERGLIQYTQMLSKGTVDMQSWRTLQETMGVGLNDLAKAFGFAGSTAQNELYGALQSGTITFDQLNSKLVELDGGMNGFAERAKVASAGIGTSLQNIKTAMVKATTTVIEATDKMLEDNGFPKLEETINSAKTGINQGAQMIATAIGEIGPVVIALGPALKIGAAAWLAYEASMKVSKTITATTGAITSARQAVELSRSATELSAKSEKIAGNATIARDKALRISIVSESLDTKAKVASAAATKAKTVATKAATAATKARNAASKAGWMNAELNAKSEVLEAAATKAGADADRLATIAETKKTRAKTISNKSSIANASAQAAETAATTASATANTADNVTLTVKQALLGGLAANLGIVATAQMVWNTAMAANPIGALIALAAGLTVATVGITKVLGGNADELDKLKKHTDKLASSSKDLIKDINDATNSHKDNITSINAESGANAELTNKIDRLSRKENKSLEDKALLQSYVSSLNSSMQNLGLQYDAENDSLNMGTDAIYAKIQAYKAQAEAQATQARYLELLKNKMEIEEKLNTIGKESAERQKNESNLINASLSAMKEYTSSQNKMKETKQSLMDKQEEVANSIQYYDGVMAESARIASNTVSDSTQKQATSLEDLNESQQSVVQGLSATWQSYAEQATNMFDVLSDKSELSVAQMTENMQENQRVIGAWADNIANLAARGIDDGLLEQLRQAGPESAGYVNAMVQASDVELQQMSEVFRVGGETATKAFGATIGGAEVSADVMNLVTKTKDTVAQQIAAADFGSIGKNVVAGMTEGIHANAGSATTAGTAVGEAVKAGTTGSLDIHSPSGVFMGYGANTIQGFVIGVQGQQEILNTAMQSAMTSAGQSAVSAMDLSIARLGTITSVSFTSISTSTRNGMSKMTNEIISGSRDSNAAMNTGLKSMESSVKSSMGVVQSTTTNGMRTFVESITMGMTSAKSSVSSGVNGMILNMAILKNSFYSSGVYASTGLANGIYAGADKAISAANSLATSVAETMRKALEIKSPSRVMKEIGGFTTEGFVIGLLNGIHDVESASNILADTIIPGDVSRKLSYVGNMAEIKKDSYNFEENRTYTIIVPVDLEGREIAKVIAPYTQEELEKLASRNSRKRGNR